MKKVRWKENRFKLCAKGRHKWRQASGMIQKMIFLTGLSILVFSLAACGSVEAEHTGKSSNVGSRGSGGKIQEVEEETNTEISPETSLGNLDWTGVEYGCALGSIALKLPENWDYVMNELDETEVENPGDEKFGIDIYPKGKEGKISISYWGSFGVCGTGLEEECITIHGMTASMGTYDNNEFWSFIHFTDEYAQYVIIAVEVEDWTADDKEQVMEILDTITFNENITKEETESTENEKVQQMVQINGNLYYGTGEESDCGLRCGNMDGIYNGKAGIELGILKSKN